MASTTLPDLIDGARDLQLPDDDPLETMRQLLTLRNLVDHLAATAVGALDRLGIAAVQGRTLRELLIGLGCAPGVATRLIRVGGALPVLPTVVAHCADRAISGEHVDAIVKGMNHIAARAPNPVTEEARFEQVTDLLGSSFLGPPRGRSRTGPACSVTGPPAPTVVYRPAKTGPSTPSTMS